MQINVKVCLIEDATITGKQAVLKALFIGAYRVLLETDAVLNNDCEIKGEPPRVIKEPVSGRVFICYTVPSPTDGTPLLYTAGNNLVQVKSLGDMSIDINTRSTMQKQKGHKK